MSTDEAVAAVAAHENVKHLPAGKLAARRTELEAEIYRAIRLFEDETGFGVKGVTVSHPLRLDNFEAVRWGGFEAPLPCSVSCSLYSSVMKGRAGVGAGEVDAAHLLPEIEWPHHEAYAAARQKLDGSA